MEVTFESGNPSGGDQSSILVFSSDDGTTTRIGFDAGTGVRNSKYSTSQPDPTLDALFLSHGHTDHIAESGMLAGPETTVYASTETKRLMQTRLESPVDSAEYGDNIASRVTVADSEVAVTDAISVYPLPAGHTLGARSWLVLAQRPMKSPFSLLVTGDFDFRRTGTTPPFPTSLPGTLDALLVNTPTTDDHESAVDDALETARNAFPDDGNDEGTLHVSASWLTALDFACELNGAIAQSPTRPDVAFVGRAPNILKDAETTLDHIDTDPESRYAYEEFHANYDIVITTPPGYDCPPTSKFRQQTPASASLTSVQLYVSDDRVVDKVDEAIHWSPHPSETQIESLVTDFNPLFLIKKHGPAESLEREDMFVLRACQQDPVRLVGTDHPPSLPWLGKWACEEIRTGNKSTDQKRDTRDSPLPEEIQLRCQPPPVASTDPESNTVDSLEPTAEAPESANMTETNTSSTAADSTDTETAPATAASSANTSSNQADSSAEDSQQHEGAPDEDKPESVLNFRRALNIADKVMDSLESDMQRAEVKNLNGTKIAVLDDEMDVSEGDSVWVLPGE